MDITRSCNVKSKLQILELIHHTCSSMASGKFFNTFWNTIPEIFFENIPGWVTCVTACACFCECMTRNRLAAWALNGYRSVFLCFITRLRDNLSKNSWRGPQAHPVMTDVGTMLCATFSQSYIENYNHIPPPFPACHSQNVFFGNSFISGHIRWRWISPKTLRCMVIQLVS